MQENSACTEANSARKPEGSKLIEELVEGRKG